MSLKQYLDKFSLTYFLNKIKNLFDNTFVHKSGREAIQNIKSFKHPSIVIHNDNIPLSNDVLPNTVLYNEIFFCGTGFDYRSGIDNINVSRLGEFQYTLDQFGNRTLMSKIRVKVNNVNKYSQIGVAYDATNDCFYGTAPATSSIRTSDTDIITRNWIPNDTRIVHTTGDENIQGVKIFNNHYVVMKSKVLEYNVTPTEYVPLSLIFNDKSGNRVGMLQYGKQTSNGTRVLIECIKHNKTALDSDYGTSIVLGYDENGNKYFVAPSTSTTRTNGTDVVTRDFIPNDTRIVHTTGTETIGGYKVFKNKLPNNQHASGIVISNSEVTRGTAPSTASKYSVISLCDSSGTDWATDGYHGRIGVVRAFIDTSNNAVTQLTTYKSAAGSTANDSFAMKYPATGDPYTYGPHCYPNHDNQYYLGCSTWRWKQLVAATTTIATSDERLKDNINNIPEEVLDVWSEVNWNQFQFKDAIKEKGENARIHIGLIAQRIKSIFEKHNLDATKYGLLCYDEWNEELEEKDEEGNITREYIPAGNRYSLRYEECLCIEAAYQRRKIKTLEEKNKQLENEIALLKEEMKTLKELITNKNN